MAIFYKTPPFGCKYSNVHIGFGLTVQKLGATHFAQAIDVPTMVT
jgi:hypothetical protein